MNDYCLFIDELGTPDPKDFQSDVYVLCGCAVKENRRRELSIRADQIKFKYWERTDMIFHSRDIGRNSKEFSIFNDDLELRVSFFRNLFGFLQKAGIITFVVLVDKKLCREKGWDKTKIIKETTHKLIYNFIAFLLSCIGRKGRVVIESATSEKDGFFLNSFSYFLSPGFKELSVDYKKIRESLTSISFVTKNNLDIEEQIADLFAYAAKCKYLRESKQQEFTKDTYEAKIIKIFESKLFSKPVRAGERKMKFFEKIEPFCVLPK